MLNVEEKIKLFKTKYRKKCFALADWKNLQAQSRDLGLNEILACICEAANGSMQEMANIIDHLTAKDKKFGRTQVYGDHNNKKIDITRGEDGKLVLTGYNPEGELPLKGQHLPKNPKIFRKSDNEINKNFQKAEERMYDLGAKVRELYPDRDNHYITFAMQAIRKYAEQKKIHTDKVIKGLQKGRYKLDDELWRIVPNAVNEGKNSSRHIIFVNESDLSRIVDMIEMTEQKFHANMRHFISMLLQDPVNATVPYIFSQRNITRSALLAYLLGGKDPILIRDQRISDRDENGQPKTATMMVKFRCPKKNFDRKLQKLYIKMFEKNLPERKKKESEEEVDEATGCGANGAAGGAFVAPVFPMQRRTFTNESTTTFNTGKYTYDLPVLGDKESCKRHNGKGGSVSVNHVKKKKKRKTLVKK